MSASLYDSTVWLALSFASHPGHAVAANAFSAAGAASPAAFCRATQTSFLRLLTSPRIQAIYGSAAISNDQAWQALSSLQGLAQVAFLDEPAGLEALWKNLSSRSASAPKVWMDAYLAAFAIRAGVLLTTLDTDFKTWKRHGLRLQLLVP